MGCTQTSESVIPLNHVPIDRIYNNGDYRIAQPLPAVNIVALPTPPYVKSALKKTCPDMRGRADTFPFAQSKPPPFNKGVNFDEQVLVKARTPTPTKVWYEKASSTMPMRRHGCNDDDDYDYDNEEPQPDSSDEEQIDQEQNDRESQLPTPRPPTPINRIKVRRQLPNLGSPQILPVPLYQSSTQSSIVPAYQIPAQTSIIPPYQIPIQRTLPNINAIHIEQQRLRTHSELLPQTTYYPYARPPLGNVT